MKLLFRTIFLIAISALPFISACGGGGSSSGSPAPNPNGTYITGSVAKGLIKAGRVELYGISGQTETLLTFVATDNNGEYKDAFIGNYTGVLLIKAFGDYTDEADGTQKSIPSTNPLRAVTIVKSSTGKSTLDISVTPITDLAVRKAQKLGGLTETNIASANALLADIYQFDPLATRPKSPDAKSLISATQDEQCYTLVLAAISKLAPSNSALETLLTGYQSDLELNRLKDTSISIFRDAVRRFLASSNNITGFKNISSVPKFLYIGSSSMVITIKSSGTADAGTATQLLQFAVKLKNPLVSLKTDSSGNLLSGVLTTTADQSTVYYSKTDNILRVALTNGKGFGIGTIATLKITTAPGYSPATTDISIEPLPDSINSGKTLPFASDLTGNIIAGINLLANFPQN
jgi:hypothetical protein